MLFEVHPPVAEWRDQLVRLGLAGAKGPENARNTFHRTRTHEKMYAPGHALLWSQNTKRPPHLSNDFAQMQAAPRVFAWDHFG